MIFEVGQLWKTRGGWNARVVAKIKSKTPLIVIHETHGWHEDEHAESHKSDGSLFIDPANSTHWDLVTLLEELA